MPRLNATTRTGFALVAAVLIAWVAAFLIGDAPSSQLGGESGSLATVPSVPVGSPEVPAAATAGSAVPAGSDVAADTVPDSAPVVPDSAVSSVDEPVADTTPGRFTIAVTGDVLPHAPMLATKRSGSTDDFRGVFDEIRPVVAGANLAICHMEAPIMEDGQALRTQPLLGTPPALLRAVADAGFDRCSTASNHAFDGGEDGVHRSIRAFADAGMGQSGMNDSADSVADITTVNGVKVAHLSYTYGLDNKRPPQATRWLVNIIETNSIVRAASAARKRGAEVVIVSLHWGEPQHIEPTDAQQRVAEALTASGKIDLIVGHHGHVLQPIRKVNGVWVVFGLGNILSNHPANPGWKANTQDAAVVTVGFRRSGRRISVDNPVVWPTWCDKGHGYVIRLAQDGHRAADLPSGVAAALDASLRRTEAVLGRFIAS